MFTNIVRTTRPDNTVPFYHESVEGKKYHEFFDAVRAAADGFQSIQTEKSEDNLVVVNRIVWDTEQSKLAFQEANAPLFEKMSADRKAYNKRHGIKRKVIGGDIA